MAANAKTAFGEASTAYKAFAIAQATIATYTSAIEAYKSTAAIPVVGPFLAPVAAATAVAAGLANIAKIRSAREQGGQLSAGQASTIAERGKPEVIMPAGASRVRTAKQMKEIMGQNGSPSGGDNVTIVNNTTGRVDSAVTERDDEGRLRIIISETVASQLQDNNSPISKARRSTRGQPGY
jgi:SLT domain-containing protein